MSCYDMVKLSDRFASSIAYLLCNDPWTVPVNPNDNNPVEPDLPINDKPVFNDTTIEEPK